MDKLTIVNMALSLLSEQRKATSIDPPAGTPYAETAALFLPIALAQCLELHAWGFATTRMPGVSVALDPSVGYAYGYAVPSDSVRVISVEPQQSPAAGHYSFGGGYDGFGDSYPDLYSPRLMGYSIEGGIIFANIPSAVIRYVTGNVSYAAMPVSFATALAYLLAHYMAGSVGRDVAAKGQYFLQMYATSVRSAIAQDVAAQRVSAWSSERSAPWVSGR